jgi:carbon-monoxide dehydrogenase medium subunit
LGELGEKARPLAGGTDLIVNLKKKLVEADHLIGLTRLDELRRMEGEENGLQIGGCITAAELAASPQVEERFPALAEGASRLGSPLIRNLATAAGNLVSARPAADLPPPLMAYGATAEIRTAEGGKSVPLDEFFQGPGATVLDQGEILALIRISPDSERHGAAYLKLGVREALEISIVNVASYLGMEGDTIQNARVVLGAVAPTPIRARSAEEILKGEKPGRALFEKAAQAAAQDARPIDDFRGSAAYRRDMVVVLTRRTLETAFKRIK